MKPIFIVLTLLLFGFTASTQDVEESITMKTRGFSVDVLPLLSELFSDDGPDRLVRIGYIWSNDRNVYHEIGVAPQLVVTNSESINGSVSDENTDIGLDVDYSIVWAKPKAGKFFLHPGLITSAGYRSLKSQDNNGFDITENIWNAKVGMLVRFGFQVNDRVWIRTSTDLSLQYNQNKTEIEQDFFPPITGDQKITTTRVSVNTPDQLEIIYLF